MLHDNDLLTVRVELTPAERDLMVRYGHPLSRIEAALKAVASSRAVETVELNTFELDRLIADVCYFVADGDVSRSVHDDAYDLCERLECARQTGDGHSMPNARPNYTTHDVPLTNCMPNPCAYPGVTPNGCSTASNECSSV